LASVLLALESIADGLECPRAKVADAGGGVLLDELAGDVPRLIG